MPALALAVDNPPPHPETLRMPLKLKGVLIRHGIEQRDLGESLIQTQGYAQGKPISKTAINALIARNVWPKLTPRADIEGQIAEFLRAHGVPAAEIGTAFELEDGDPFYRSRAAAAFGRDTRAASQSQTAPKYDIDPIETEMLTSEARKVFSLFRDPFIDDVRGPEDVFMTRDQRHIREHMYATAKHGGLLAVIGESGSGKTTLYNDLMDRISSHGEPIVVIAPSVLDVDLGNLKTRLTARRILESIVAQLTGNRPGMSMEKLTRQARQALIAATSHTGERQASVALVIEEAHSLLPATLKVLKRLLELREGHRTLLGVILIAQPEMHELLNEVRYPELREFIARCQVATLEPLDNAVEDYLRAKLKRVGADYGAIFAPDAADAIQQRLIARERGTNKTVSMVYPLRVNRTVARAMNLAAQIGETRITAEIIRGA